jgi:hypothetical protein
MGLREFLGILKPLAYIEQGFAGRCSQQFEGLRISDLGARNDKKFPNFTLKAVDFDSIGQEVLMLYGANDGARTRDNQNHNLKAYIKRYMAYKVIHGYFFNFSIQ